METVKNPGLGGGMLTHHNILLIVPCLHLVAFKVVFLNTGDLIMHSGGMYQWVFCTGSGVVRTTVSTGSTEIFATISTGEIVDFQETVVWCISMESESLLKTGLRVSVLWIEVTYEGEGSAMPSLLIPEEVEELRVAVAAAEVGDSSNSLDHRRCLGDTAAAWQICIRKNLLG